MNERKPSLLERITAAVVRWAYEQHRAAEDEKYWQDAQHDPRLVVDINRARERSELEGPVAPSPRPTPCWSMLTPLMPQRGAVDH